MKQINIKFHGVASAGRCPQIPSQRLQCVYEEAVRTLAVTERVCGSHYPQCGQYPYTGSLTPKQVVQQCLEAYSAVESYSGTSTVYNQDALPWMQPQTATIQFVRPGKIRVTGADSNGTAYTIISDGTTSFLLANEAWQKMTSTGMAIGGATGISGEAATTIPALLLHTGWGDPFPRKHVFSPLTLSDVDGHPCYSVTDTGFPGSTHTFWIDRKNFLLRRFIQDDAGTNYHVRNDIHFTIAALNQPIPTSTFALPTGQ